MHLVLVARREKPMRELAEDLHTRHGTRTEVMVCDLSEPDAIRGLVADVEARDITIELLVNNAGFAVVGDVDHTDIDRILDMVQLNVSALTELTYRVLPGMLERGHGAIVNMASLAAFQPVAYMGAYAASKAFVLHMSEALWAETHDRGVTVMALCPGVTETGFFDVAGVPGWLAKQRSQTAEQVVRSALRGLKKRRQSWITGWKNYLLSLLVRIATRRTVVKESMKYFRPQKKKEKKTKKTDDAS
jgi:hypothetical protein